MQGAVGGASGVTLVLLYHLLLHFFIVSSLYNNPKIIILIECILTKIIRNPFTLCCKLFLHTAEEYIDEVHLFFKKDNSSSKDTHFWNVKRRNKKRRHKVAYNHVLIFLKSSNQFFALIMDCHPKAIFF